MRRRSASRWTSAAPPRSPRTAWEEEVAGPLGEVGEGADLEQPELEQPELEQLELEQLERELLQKAETFP